MFFKCRAGISVEEARGMDLMMVNAWRPFSWCENRHFYDAILCC